MKHWSCIWKQFSLVGQLGLSLAAPLLLCLFAGSWLTDRFGLGVWVFAPLFVLGLGGSFVSAWKLYRMLTAAEEKKSGERAAFNRHD